MTNSSKNRQVLLEARVGRFLLKERLSKTKKPYLVDSIVSKLERSEGLEVPPSLYVQRTSKKGPLSEI